MYQEHRSFIAVTHLRLWCREGSVEHKVPKKGLGQEVLWGDVEKQQLGVLKLKRPLFLRGASHSQKPQLQKKWGKRPRRFSHPPQEPCLHTLHFDLFRGDSSRGQAYGFDSLRQHPRLLMHQRVLGREKFNNLFFNPLYLVIDNIFFSLIQIP